MPAMKIASRFLLVATLLVLGLISAWSATAGAQTKESASKRPPIVGVSHIGLNTNDMDAARKFYTGVLGLAEPFSLDKPKEEGGGLDRTFFKVNDHQYVEMFPDLKDPKDDRLNHIAFETTNAEELRAYMASQGVEVPEKVTTTRERNYAFTVHDPDGHLVEFVELRPGSLQSRDFGKHLPSTRISQRIIHVGVVVSDRAAGEHFYKDVLGFRPKWFGGMTGDRTDWVSLCVPDGSDWVELMLNVKDPTPRTLGVMNHLALGVPKVGLSFETVVERGDDAEKPKIGRDGKWQLNLYHNLTRVELMEPKPVETPCCSPILR
jgi:catechol 2,3-dioxygenase-like lactoylglutathione lyase family enzyme